MFSKKKVKVSSADLSSVLQNPAQRYTSVVTRYKQNTGARFVAHTHHTHNWHVVQLDAHAFC